MPDNPIPDGTRSPLLDAPGAVEADPPDQTVAAHYGKPTAEQRRLIAGDAVVDLSHHDVLTISGPDRLSWLNDITSQDFAQFRQHQWSPVLILNAQGRIEYDFQALDDGAQIWIHTEQGAALMDYLTSMVFINRVELATVTSDWALIGYVAGSADDQAGTDGTAGTAELAHRLIPRVELAQQSPAGLWAWEALRIITGIVRIGLDTDEKTIPNEIGLPGVALDKGCYRGQETVARVHNLGRPPRRLVCLELDGSADRLPERGAELTWGDKTIGWVGTSARHHEHGPVALGLVKRNTDTEAELLADGIAASQSVLVDPGVGLHIRPKL